MKRKITSTLLVLIFLVSLLANVWTVNAKGGKQTVTFGTPTSPAGTFNPVLDYMGGDIDIDSIVYASLLRTDAEGNVEPYLAEDFTISDDNLKLEFKLRDDVKWQDGEPLTVDDIVYTIECLANDEKGSNRIATIKGVKEFASGEADHISGLQVSDDKKTLTIELSEVFAPLVIRLGTYGILPKHIWGEIPKEEWEKKTELLNNPIGSGPYQVTKYEPGQYVELEAYEDFFLGAPKIKKLIYKTVNQDAIAAELISGGVDIVTVKELRTSELEDLVSRGFTMEKVADNMYQYIAFNLRQEIFQDKRLRQAMLYAIDRELLLGSIVEGRGTLIDSPFLPTSWASPDPDELNPYKADPEKAIALLEDAGYTEIDSDGIRSNSNGDKLQFQLRCSNDSKTREHAVLYAKECWKKIGIDVDVSIEEDAVVAEDCIFNHNFEMYALNCYFGEDPDPYGWWHSNSASDEVGVGSFNFGSYKVDSVDEAIDKGNATLKQDERKTEYLKVAKQINEDVPIIFLYVQDREIMVNPKLQGFQPHTFNIFYDIANWSFDD